MASEAKIVPIHKTAAESAPDTETLKPATAQDRRPSKKRESLKRSRVLKRGGVHFAPFAEAHLPYAWAAYRRGIFSAMMDDGLTPSQFSERLEEFAGAKLAEDTELWTSFAATEAGIIPIALVTIQFSMTPGGRLAQPHVFRHLGKYGLLRAMGTFRDFFGSKEDATFFHGVR
jgi:hypothetical protein